MALKEFFSSPQKKIYFLYLIILINILVINFFLLRFTTPADSESYFELVDYFRGKIGAPESIWRILKPMVPFLVAKGSSIFSPETSFLLVNSIFYFLTGLIVFKIIYLLFNNENQALAGSALYLLAYPMLEYGITFTTDLAGWFFFVLSIYLALLFLKAPSYRIIILNGFLTSLGFLAKEYAVVGVVFFTFCLFFINRDNLWQKIKYLLAFSFIFLIPFVLWQTFVYLKFNYNYLDWYGRTKVGREIYEREIFRLIIKSLGAAFLLGWSFVLIGLIKIKQTSLANKKVILALILPSFSFLLWPGASSRLYYIVGLLLSILASWGFVSIVDIIKKKYIWLTLLIIIMAGNYFWFIFDDRLRFIFESLFKVTY